MVGEPLGDGTTDHCQEDEPSILRLADRERQRAFEDEKQLRDIRFGYTATDSIYASVDNDEEFTLTDHLGIGYEDSHINESMLVNDVLGLIKDLSDIEQRIVRRKMIESLDTDNESFKGMQFSEEETDPEMLKEIRQKLQHVRSHLQ